MSCLKGKFTFELLVQPKRKRSIQLQFRDDKRNISQIFNTQNPFMPEAL